MESLIAFSVNAIPYDTTVNVDETEVEVFLVDDGELCEDVDDVYEFKGEEEGEDLEIKRYERSNNPKTYGSEREMVEKLPEKYGFRTPPPNEFKKKPPCTKQKMLDTKKRNKIYLKKSMQRNMMQDNQRLRRLNCFYKKKIKSLKNRKIVELIEDSKATVEVKTLGKLMFAHSKGTPFSESEKKFAMSLRHNSPKGYEFLRRSGIPLPCRPSLNSWCIKHLKPGMYIICILN